MNRYRIDNTCAVPCRGRMLALKSSSWLRALMRSSSSWMVGGQSVISWRHDLEKKQGHMTTNQMTSQDPEEEV